MAGVCILMHECSPMTASKSKGQVSSRVQACEGPIELYAGGQSIQRDRFPSERATMLYKMVLASRTPNCISKRARPPQPTGFQGYQKRMPLL